MLMNSALVYILIIPIYSFLFLYFHIFISIYLQNLEMGLCDLLQDFSSSWDIKATPTFFFLKNGQQIGKLVGANKPELQKKITSILDSVPASSHRPWRKSVLMSGLVSSSWWSMDVKCKKFLKGRKNIWVRSSCFYNMQLFSFSLLNINIWSSHSKSPSKKLLFNFDIFTIIRCLGFSYHIIKASISFDKTRSVWHLRIWFLHHQFLLCMLSHISQAERSRWEAWTHLMAKG